MLKKIMILIVLLALLPAWAGCGGLPQSAVAEVNGKVITKEDLDQALEMYKQQYAQGGMPAEGTEEYEQLKKTVVQQLVDEEILWFEAEKMELSVSEEEIKYELDRAIGRAGGEEQLQQALEEANTTMDEFKNSIRESLLFQKLYPEVTKDAPEVTDAEARKFYDENPDQFEQPEMRTVSHILVATEAEAAAVKQRLAAGEDFAAVAAEVSTDPGSKSQGGSLGQVPSENSGMVPEFEQGMNQLQAGQISDPVKSQFGYHIIRVEAITPPGIQPFETVLEDLKRGLLLEAQRKVFDAWLDGVRGNYEIIYADEFKPDETTTQTTTTATTAE